MLTMRRTVADGVRMCTGRAAPRRMPPTVMPNVDAANISYNLLRVAAGNGITVGGILLGAARPVHILTPSSTVRRIVNMTALAVVDVAAHRPTARSID